MMKIKLHKTYPALLVMVAYLIACTSDKPKEFQCSDHDWQSVEEMVFPYLEDDMQTAMIMQAQSSEYKTEMAADFALTFETSYPDSVVQVLKKLKDC